MSQDIALTPRADRQMSAGDDAGKRQQQILLFALIATFAMVTIAWITFLGWLIVALLG